MAKQKGTVLDALRKTLHHASPTVFEIQLRMGQLNADAIRYRCHLMQSNLTSVISILTEIRSAAQMGDLAKVRELLETQVEYGHDFEN